MKRILSCIVVLLLLTTSIIPFAASAADGAAMLSVSSAAACPGKTVMLTVDLQNSSIGVAGLDITLTYDASVMTCISGPEISGSLGGLNVFCNAGNAGRVKIICDAYNNVTASGNLVTLAFAINATAPAGSYVVSATVQATAVGATATVTPVSGIVTVAHTPAADDGDCTTPVTCTSCGQTIIDAKTHVDADGDRKCDNSGCNYQFPVTCPHPMTSTRTMVVTPATCITSGSGFTMVYCTVCGQTISTFPMTLPATNAHVDENEDGKCDVCGKVLVEQHVHELVHTEAKAATCTEDGNIEYWYCAGCDSYFTDAESQNKVDAADVVVPAAHKVEHVAAKEATETEDGNIEYWRCTECNKIWLDADCTNAAELEDVVIPATGTIDPEHKHELVHTEAKAATCFEEGNLEYWYCAGCDCYFTDDEGKFNIAYLSLIVPVSHKIEHVAAVDATCFEEGNIEYWYCTECGYAWLDELCTKNTNLKAVILPVSHKIVHVAAKAPTATEEGNIEYWYCTECGYAWLDELCIRNTNLKAVILPATGEDIPNPPTGDASILYIAAVAVIATLGVAVISFKKREEN